MREPNTRQELLQQRVLRQVDQWCAEYEAKIRALGGIGFFMGGIGPDGHVAFNCQGCDHFATTRLDQLNYASQAAAAGDLGGIETVRRRKVITIGLGTITYNPNCVALICAAGEAKAQVVRNAVQEAAHVNFPATALHRLPSAAFFVTTGAAKLLDRRQLELLERMPEMAPSVVERVLVALSGRRRKKLVDLSEDDLAACPLASCAVRRAGRPLPVLAEEVRQSLIRKIEQGSRVREKTKTTSDQVLNNEIAVQANDPAESYDVETRVQTLNFLSRTRSPSAQKDQQEKQESKNGKAKKEKSEAKGKVEPKPEEEAHVLGAWLQDEKVLELLKIHSKKKGSTGTSKSQPDVPKATDKGTTKATPGGTQEMSSSARTRKFLHTEPHHDDIMLGYLPAVMRNTRVASNQHHFVCATSSFNSVSNVHMLKMLGRVEKFLGTPTYKRLCQEGYFDPSTLDFRRRDVWKFLDGIAAADDELRDEGAARRLVYNLSVIFEDSARDGNATQLLERVSALKTYFSKQYAGQKDMKEVQILKGACREFEAECVWGYIGWQLPNISHLRLGFYTADIFAPEPTQQRDVVPVLKLLREVQPDVVSVALDPEASGPDTHYKVLQAVTAALQQYSEESDP
ncbi:GNPDA1, partial [Symbiodinium sp. KB8]